MKLHILSLLILLISLTYSCNNEKSLQQFFVAQQEKQDMISFDLSTSLLAGVEELKNEKDIEILKSLKKINILAYQIKEAGYIRYNTEKQQINAILKQDKYSELMRYGKGSKGAKIYLVGDEDAIDELIIFANDDKLGWLIIRILGKNMQPAKIMQLIQKVDFDKTDFDLSQLKTLLSQTQ